MGRRTVVVSGVGYPPRETPLVQTTNPVIPEFRRHNPETVITGLSKAVGVRVQDERETAEREDGGSNLGLGVDPGLNTVRRPWT